MFVITADQIDSRNDRDRAGEMIAQLTADLGHAFSLPADQTSGDEIQILMPTARAALTTILALHRSGFWSIGLGVGSVRTPLPAATRQATGEAFIAARTAVTRAKKTDARFALSLRTSVPDAVAATDTAPDAATSSALLNVVEVEALVAMLLLLRQRRSVEGWEATDLLEQGLPQVEIAAILGISTAAVSQRVKSALWRVDEAARPALVRLLENLDRATSETDPAE
ncbi:DNA-binding protein [Cryobacterium frigoriphilum]|uniref:DNA-binding protein n=1 Tax=Cryobacterium frigoriphilum TaxID=1259150 RepID=A0A4R9A4Z7_9MICO|nr:sigma factor-like helix-turn-helix DNA-binding protein [Cryobacterium frigoriphilum]TFD52213.1 DNA-binding protein [Cryobacterium frigoriphilum]